MALPRWGIAMTQIWIKGAVAVNQSTNHWRKMPVSDIKWKLPLPSNVVRYQKNRRNTMTCGIFCCTVYCDLIFHDFWLICITIWAQLSSFSLSSCKFTEFLLTGCSHHLKEDQNYKLYLLCYSAFICKIHSKCRIMSW